MRYFGAMFLMLVMTFLLGLPAKALELYAIGTGNALMPGPVPTTAAVPIIQDSVLYLINPETGEPTEIGPITGYTRCTALDIHPFTEEFFAVCERNELKDNGEDDLQLNAELPTAYLLRLRPDTAQATEVGPIELPSVDFISDISFRTSDGTLFAHINSQTNNMEEEVTANGLAANSLAVIDTQTAALTILGSTGLEDRFSAIGFNAMGILIHATDNVALAGRVSFLNQTNGGASHLADIAYPPYEPGEIAISSMDLDYSTGDFFAILVHLASPNDPKVKTSVLDRGNYLININEQTGVVEEIGLIAETDQQQFGALAVRSEKMVAEVPTLSEYGLMATVVLLLGTAVVFLRRRQVKSSI